MAERDLDLVDVDTMRAPRGPGPRLWGPALWRTVALWLPAVVVAVPVWFLMSVLNKQGLDFSVYWHGGKILNDAGWAVS